MVLRPLILCLLFILVGCAGRNTVFIESSVPTKTNLSNVPFFPQQPLHCGPAALATVLNYYDGQSTPTSLTDQLWTPEAKGTFSSDMIATVRAHELVPIPAPKKLSELLELTSRGWPSIHLLNLGFKWLPQWHYAVLVGYDLEKQAVLMRSGTTEERWYSFYQFERTRRLAGYWSIIPSPLNDFPAMNDWKPSFKEVLNMLEVRPDLGNRVLVTSRNTYPEQWQFKYATANSFYGQSRFKEAAEFYIMAIEQSSREPEVWNNLAYTYQQLQCQDLAVLAVTCATKIEPENAEWQDSYNEITGLIDEKIPSTCQQYLRCPVE